MQIFSTVLEALDEIEHEYRHHPRFTGSARRLVLADEISEAVSREVTDALEAGLTTVQYERARRALQDLLGLE